MFAVSTLSIFSSLILLTSVHSCSSVVMYACMALAFVCYLRICDNVLIERTRFILISMQNIVNGNDNFLMLKANIKSWNTKPFQTNSSTTITAAQMLYVFQKEENNASMIKVICYRDILIKMSSIRSNLMFRLWNANLTLLMIFEAVLSTSILPHLQKVSPRPSLQPPETRVSHTHSQQSLLQRIFIHIQFFRGCRGIQCRFEMLK